MNFESDDCWSKGKGMGNAARLRRGCGLLLHGAKRTNKKKTYDAPKLRQQACIGCLVCFHDALPLTGGKNGQ